jgi:toxin ParE1/3/4
MVWALRRSEKAIDDLTGIHDYIAADNGPAADRVVLELLALFDKTALHPELGRPADDIGEHVRILTRGSYLLIYRLHTAEEAVELVRVVHGARDWKALFDA